MKNRILSTALLLLSFPVLAQNVPHSMTYQGRLMTGSSETPLTGNVDLTFQIYNPTETCLLYEEKQSLVPLNDGLFSVTIGSAIGSSKRSNNDPALDFAQLFSNSVSAPLRSSSSANCNSGYTPANGDKRKLKVSVYSHALSFNQVLEPSQDVYSTGYALSVQSLQGKTINDFILIESPNFVNRLQTILADTFLNKMLAAINNTNFASNPASPGANDLVTKGYVDGSIAGKAAPSTSGAGGKYLKYDGTNLVFDDITFSGGGVTSVAGKTGVVTLAIADVVNLQTSLDSKISASKLALNCSAAQVPCYTNDGSSNPNCMGAADTYQCRNIQIPSSVVSGLAASATTDTTNAANITSGTLSADRFPASFKDRLWSAGSGNVWRTTGNVGIGTNNPTAKLHINGEMKVGNSGAPCDSGTPDSVDQGMQRYNLTTKRMEFCNGTQWITMKNGT
jgi:hypothetical protein